MKLLYLAVQLAIAVYIAKFLSGYVISGKYYFITAILVGTVFFLLSSWKHKFIILTVMIFFPIRLPDYFHIPTRSFAELIAPVLCMTSALEIFKKGKSFVSRKASLYFMAIGILVLWSIVHYINNPVLGQQVFGVQSQAGGLRTYYMIFAGVTVFLSSYWFIMNNEVNADRWLITGLVVTIIIGNLFVIGNLFQNFNLFNFKIGRILSLGQSAAIMSDQYHSIPLRIIASLLSVLLLSVFHTRKWGFVFIIVFVQLLVFMLLGGGRASLPAIFLSIVAYVALINRKYLFPVLSVLLICTGIYVMLLSNISFSEMKYGRVFAIEGGLEKRSEARYYSFLYMFEVFRSSPVFGKGIGYQELTSQDDFFVEYPEAIQYIEYIRVNATAGGHGAYLSVLSLFGIGGIFWLMVMLFGSIYYSYKIMLIRGQLPNNVKLALFAFLYSINFSIVFIVGGGGHTNVKLWFWSGIVAGLLSKDQYKEESAGPVG